MVRRLIVLAALALSLPIAAFANSTTILFSNTAGSMTLQKNKSLLGSSTLTSFTGLSGITTTGTLGSVSYQTGSLLSGSIATSATFAAGGWFTINGNGTNGLPTGMIFGGSFSGPVSWVGSFNPHANAGKGAWTYVLTGTLAGNLYGIGVGSAVGGTVQLTFDVPSGNQFSRSIRLNKGVTSVTVPEPGTLSLLGSGLIGLGIIVRRRRFAKT